MISSTCHQGVHMSVCTGFCSKTQDFVWFRLQVLVFCIHVIRKYILLYRTCPIKYMSLGNTYVHYEEVHITLPYLYESLEYTYDSKFMSSVGTCHQGINMTASTCYYDVKRVRNQSQRPSRCTGQNRKHRGIKRYINAFERTNHHDTKGWIIEDISSSEGCSKHARICK